MMFRARNVIVGCVLAIVVLGAGFAGAAAANDRNYSLALAPDGSTKSSHKITGTITNWSTHNQLNTVDVILPADAPPTFRIGSAKTDRGTATVSGDKRIAQFRDLKIPSISGSTVHSLKVEIFVNSTCVGGGPWLFDSAGKLANHFNGTNNDFTLDRGKSTLDITFASGEACTATETQCSDSDKPPADIDKAVEENQEDCRVTVVVKGRGVTFEDTPDGSDETTAADNLLPSLDTTQTRSATIHDAQDSGDGSTTWDVPYTLTFDVTAFETIDTFPSSGTLTATVKPGALLDCEGLVERIQETGISNYDPGLQPAVSPRQKIVQWTITYHAAVPNAATRGKPAAMCHGSPLPFVTRQDTVLEPGGSLEHLFEGQLPDCGPTAPRSVVACTFARIANDTAPYGRDIIRAEVPGQLTDPAYRG